MSLLKHCERSYWDNRRFVPMFSILFLLTRCRQIIGRRRFMLLEKRFLHSVSNHDPRPFWEEKNKKKYLFSQKRPRDLQVSAQNLPPNLSTIHRNNHQPNGQRNCKSRGKSLKQEHDNFDSRLHIIHGAIGEDCRSENGVHDDGDRQLRFLRPENIDQPDIGKQPQGRHSGSGAVKRIAGLGRVVCAREGSRPHTEETGGGGETNRDLLYRCKYQIARPPRCQSFQVHTKF